MRGTQVVEKQRFLDDGSSLPSHISALRIPLAWTDVKVSMDPEANLLVTGKDSKGRAQYIYSAKFKTQQAESKFSRIEELLQEFPKIVKLNDEARKAKHPHNQAVAECLHIIMHTGIRPGSDADTKAKVQAYGASTLLKRHVCLEGDAVVLRFVGKKGVSLEIPVTDTVSADILKKRAVATFSDDGELFPTVSDGSLLNLSSKYGFKTKDFRTRHATKLALQEVAAMKAPTSEKEYEAAVRAVAKVVSKALGNTPIVALQSYINPAVFLAWKLA